MVYIIDGHNLIPKVTGLSLRDLDDEVRLIELLKTYLSATRRQAEVYFDRAPAGYPQKRKYERLTAYFVREGTPADEAIKARLRRLGREARNWTLVTSDRQVQAEGRAVGATVVSSETFAAAMLTTGEGTGARSKPAAVVSAEELQEWEDLFGGKPK
jgi:predicted RNA-binding protein with PIN domain